MGGATSDGGLTGALKLEPRACSEVLDMSTALYEKLTLLLRAFADSDEDGHAAVA